MKLEGRDLLLIVLLSVLVVGFDQSTKYLAVHYLELNERIPIVSGYFDLTLVYNKGAAFGMFSGIDDPMARGVTLGIAIGIALLAVFYILFIDTPHTWWGRAALACIIGGAVGNIIDRVRLGMVIDFFLLYYEELHWPVFNVADSAISVGVVLLIFSKPRPAHKLSESEAPKI